MKVYAVCFHTEHGDRYLAVFDKKPTDRHLSAYIKKEYPDYIRKSTGQRLIYWELVEECEVESLPKPIDVIPSI